MIAVIADDFTGAAEIGGIGLRHGLDVVIETETIQQCDADLLIIASDTRSLPAKEASELLWDITKKLLKLNPDLIYKKVDSVLRGNISKELFAQMNASGKMRSVIIAANPALKRFITKGIYYIDGVPLEETNFSKDPEYHVFSSSVSEIVGGTDVYSCLNPDSILPKNGLIIGDVTNQSDLKRWTDKIDESTLPAGASGFFDALLVNRQIRGTTDYSNPEEFGEKILYVLGSTFQKEKKQLAVIKSSGYLLSNMPEEIYFNKNFNPKMIETWAGEIIAGLNDKRKVVTLVTHLSHAEPQLSLRIMKHLGELIKNVVEKTELDELIIEGGSTTSVVLKYLNINKLYPVQEFDTGVIRMKPEGDRNLFITTKPGSYTWPDILWSNKEIMDQNKVQTLK